MERDFSICGHFFCENGCTFSSTKKKVYATTSEDFELRYLRWDYFVRAKNPPESYFKSIEKILTYLCHTTYVKYSRTMEGQSMDYDDFMSMIRVFAVSFYGTSSYLTQEDKKQEKIKAFKKKTKRNPTDKELQTADNYRLMYFIKQRLIDARHVFNMRFKNEPRDNGRALYEISPEEYKLVRNQIADKPDALGWKKVSVSDYKQISPIMENHDLLETPNRVYKFFNQSSYFVSIDGDDDQNEHKVTWLSHYGKDPFETYLEKEGERYIKPQLSDTCNLVIKNLIDTPMKKRPEIISKLKRNARKLGIDKNQYSEILKALRSHG